MEKWKEFFLNVTLDLLREHKVLTKVVFLRDKLIDQKGIVQYMRAIECPTHIIP